MRYTPSWSIVVSLILTVGCSGPQRDVDGSTDTQVPVDVATDNSQADTMPADVPPPRDVAADLGPGTDGGPDTDVFTPDVVSTDAITTDTGPTSDASACPPTGIGQACSDTEPCPGTFVCDLGRCIPQGRQTCGGFAMARCTDPVYNQCLYENGHGDVGTCFSTAERDCLCAVAATTWQCL